jgi:hypothetical protein
VTYKLTKILVLIILLNLPFLAFGQEKAAVYGKVTNTRGQSVEFANLSVIGYSGGTSTGEDGSYMLVIPANTELTLVISHISYQQQQFLINLSKGQEKELNIILSPSAEELDDVEIVDQQTRNTSFIRLDPKIAKRIPSLSGGIEELIVTMPGVSSTNELSTQYSVRGGNYDENLVYVNGIEIYRPFLIRAGQQEGLSFVNPDMASSVSFSAGGFEARYGDRMSSVLDIQYKKPTSFGGSVSLSFLGAMAHVEGLSKNQRFSYLVGTRYKTNQYFLKGLQTAGDYKPQFGDLQGLFNYKINPKWDISFLGYYALNSYQMVPKTRETVFGTINEAYKIKIFFEGQEVNRFDNYMGAVTAGYRPTNNLDLKFIGSVFGTYETETYDILGEYWIGRVETDLGSEQYGEVLEVQGVGAEMQHSRNYLKGLFASLQHQGTFAKGNKVLKWGINLQREVFKGKMTEWVLIDSAGYTLPYPPNSIGDTTGKVAPSLEMYNYVKMPVTELISTRLTSYIQNTWDLDMKNTASLIINAGLRTNYSTLNKQFLVSPRASLAYKPAWKKDFLFRFATGIYYQPPLLREYIDPYGNVNENVKAQQSIHFVLGMDLNFQAWRRPFKFTTEAYYKDLNNLNPYEIDNVRIRYFAKNNANGYAYGIDFKINGEFIKGTESWASLSLLKTAEDLNDDFYYKYFNESGEEIRFGVQDKVAVDSAVVYPGFIPRPTDQRLNFALFFQDYLPNNPTYKMYIKLLYGTALPLGPPDTERYADTLRYQTSYRRVDVGFAKQLIGGYSTFGPKNPLKYFKTMWISLEVFNLFNIRNTISYLWVRDFNGRQYAVPNYLTPRQINLKLVATF